MGEGGEKTPPTVLITGAAGYLGQAVTALAPPGVMLQLVRHFAPLPSAPAEAAVYTVDLADSQAVAALFAAANPGVVIHTAASVSPDRFESAIVQGTRNIVSACARSGAYLIHVSSDMVFDGEHAPYSETDMPNPITAYGRAKATAEELARSLPAGQATIVRTSLITNNAPLDARSEWVARSLQTNQPITLFVDELRCPIWVEDLASAIWELAVGDHRVPVIHIAGAEALSRYALGLLIANYAGLPTTKIGCALNRSQLPARPRDLRLDTRLATRLLGRALRPISVLFAPGSR